MRTPGRCTNTEGCWISASRRDVWAPVGEEFVCPNCGNPLVPPERKALSLRGLRRLALLSTIFLAVLAAGSFAAVRLSPMAVSTVRPVLTALLHAPRAIMAERLFDPRPAPSVRGHVAAPASPPAQIAVRQPSPSPAPSPPPPRYAVLTPGVATAPSATPLARPVPRPGAPAIVLYSAMPDPVARAPQPSAAPRATPPLTGGRPAQAAPSRAEPPIVVTALSEATLVVSPSAQAPVVLPVTFGRPVAPENDAEPVRLHWRYHGLVAAAPRRSVFHAEPSESVEAMCRTLEPLQ